jgi:ankyrin repeat protein
MKNIKGYTEHLRETTGTPEELGKKLHWIISLSKTPDIEEVRRLIKAGADLEVRTSDGWTPLHVAAMRGRTDAAKALIAAGADLEAKDNDDWTPLHDAAAFGHTEIAKALIQAGADLEAKNKVGWTPLHFAAARGKTEAAKALIGAGADVSTAFDSLDKLEDFFGGYIGWVPEEAMEKMKKRERARGAFGRF